MDAGARVIHCDVMDGHFVPPITIGPLIVGALADQVHDAGGLLDVHLMIERPERQVGRVRQGGRRQHHLPPRGHTARQLHDPAHQGGRLHGRRGDHSVHAGRGAARRRRPTSTSRCACRSTPAGAARRSSPGSRGQARAPAPRGGRERGGRGRRRRRRADRAGGRRAPGRRCSWPARPSSAQPDPAEAYRAILRGGADPAGGRWPHGRWTPSSPRRTSTAATARGRPPSTRWPASPSTSSAPASPPSWARRAPASRRSCTSSPASTAPRAGRCSIEGTDISSLDDKRLTELRREKFGFIFQFFNLLPVLTAEENIVLPLSIAGRKPDAEWLDQLIETVGLTDRQTHRPSRALGRPAAARRRGARPRHAARCGVRRRAHRQPRLQGERRGARPPAPLRRRARPDRGHGDP